MKVGDASGAFRSNAVCWEVETGLDASLVSSTLPSPTIVLVIPETVPVNVGDAIVALRSKAVCCDVETGLDASLVSSTLPRPTIDLVIPTVVPPMYKLPPIPTPPATWRAPDAVLVETVVLVINVVGKVTVPVNVGDAIVALRSSAVCCAVDTGLLASLVLSTLPSPTIV